MNRITKLPHRNPQRVSHFFIRLTAQIISYLFHPLFIPVYVSWFLIYVTPVFPVFDSWEKTKLMLRFLMMYTMFPLATVLLAKGLGFVSSIYLKTQKDRIIPYVACGLYYFWMWYVLRNQPEFPREFVVLSLAIFIASSAGLFLNSFLKISMHAIAVGVMSAFVMLLAFNLGENYGLYISISLFITGLVCSARLMSSDHHPLQIYLGLAVGVIAQLVAYWIE
ncbi:MAG: hypothetical protein ICV66_02310 [Chitinophagaceae bacterium]|nr:hypothetical protein [Chitinophagaceae bacterium]